MAERTTDDVRMSFREELTALLNKHSMENGSDTPDFILAQYLLSSLIVFEAATLRRRAWYDAQPTDGE